jgi:hypothetical protein
LRIKRLFFFVFLICSDFLNAQIRPEFGLKFGVNLADMRTDESTLSPRSTFHFGFEAEQQLSSKWGLQTELLYSRQGNVRRGRTEAGVKFNHILALDYLNIPIFTNYYLKDGLYISSGMQLGFLLRAQLQETVGTDSNQQNVTNNYKNADVGMILGAGYKTDWGFNVGLRYNWGFTNVLKEPQLYTVVERNSVLQLYLSYRFK